MALYKCVYYYYYYYYYIKYPVYGSTKERIKRAQEHRFKGSVYSCSQKIQKAEIKTVIPVAATAAEWLYPHYTQPLK